MRQMESRQDKPDEFQLKALKTDELELKAMLIGMHTAQVKDTDMSE